MSISYLILRELFYRKFNFVLGVISVSVAVASLAGAVIILQKHDTRTEQIISAKEAETRARMAKLEDDYRKITKGLGFNVLILPREQRLGDLFSEDFATHYMPEEYAERLAQSRVATVQHLLPSLQQKLKWPEAERTVILVGVRGEVPIAQADVKQPLLEPVPAGTMVLGWELHRSLKLKVGDKTTFQGREFTVIRLHPERGTKDDITLWISLKEAQELLDKKGQINGILALECVCAADSLDKVRSEIGRILPETQVIEFQTQTLARAEARRRAALEAKEAIEREKQNRARLRQERESLAAFLVPIVVAVAALWIAILSFSNVRDRKAEIGLWRALGITSGRLLAVFLGRTILTGLLGAALGLGGGLLIGLAWREGGVPVAPVPVQLSLGWCFMVMAGAPVMAVLAAWLPYFQAVQQDPAKILSQE